MSNFKIGQRFVSEQEPELGIGRISAVAFRNVTIEFPAVGETRIYRATGAAVKRYLLKAGASAKSEKGASVLIESVRMEDGLAVYCGRGGREIREQDLQPKAVARSSEIFEALASGHTSDNVEFLRRERANVLSCEWQVSPVRGMIGPRVNLIPHQYYLCKRACGESKLPRLMLSDEVGLGKTIEAGMIWHALKSRGRVVRTLVLVPESLKHQWMAEMMRRFNHTFTLVDEGFIRALFESGEKPNPFLQRNDVICTMELLIDQPALVEDLLNVTWDLTIVDEAHHLVCEDNFTSREYMLVNALTGLTKGLLLLTGTPLQLEPESHFNRLRMLDPVRFSDFPAFLKDQEKYRKLALDLAKLSTDPDSKLSWDDLYAIVPKNSPIRKWLENENSRTMSAGEWIRRIVDAMGTGSVVFRNTRRGVGGFPKRILHEVPLEPDATYRRYVQAAADKDPDHSTDIQENGLLITNYADGWKLDERVTWLARFLKEHVDDKVLLICEDEQVVKTLSRVLPDIIDEDEFVLFYEDLTILERDKASDRFARLDGARLLVASEIGSEGRNFQFSNNLILFDLPLDAVLVEQRIGRLDRIGQNKEIHVYVPYVLGSAQEVMFRWYNDGLDAFGAPLMGGGELFLKYTDALIEALDDPTGKLSQFVADTIPLVMADSVQLRKKIEKGRDKLLEFNSRDPEASKVITDEILKMDADERLKNLMFETLRAAGMEIEDGKLPGTYVFIAGPEVEPGSVPGMPDVEFITRNGDGDDDDDKELCGSALTATFDRTLAMAHDEVAFMSWEHPLAQGVLDMSTAVGKGTAACAFWGRCGRKGLMMQFDFIMEPSVPAEWGLSDVAGPKLIRTLVDNEGKDASELLESFESASFRDAKVPQGVPAVTQKLRFFATMGFAEAKRVAQEKMKDFADSSANAIEKRAEQEYQRMNHLLTIRGQAENSPILAVLRKNVSERKKAALAPQLRLDAVRLIVCR